MRSDIESAIIRYTIFLAICGVVLAVLFGFFAGAN
jgi:hypothetical protein